MLKTNMCGHYGPDPTSSHKLKFGQMAAFDEACVACVLRGVSFFSQIDPSTQLAVQTSKMRRRPGIADPPPRGGRRSEKMYRKNLANK